MSMNKRRVVVTGLGLVTPLGLGVKENWVNLLSGKSSTISLESDHFFKMYDLPCKVAAKIDTPALYSNLLKKNLVKNSDLKSMSVANVYALVTAEEAIKDSGWSARNEIESYRAGCSIGTGMAGIQEVSEAAVALYKDNLKGIKTLSPYFIPKILPNLSAGLVSIKHKLKGPNHCVTTACAAGADSIMDAFNFIRNGTVDMMVCGATESCIHPVSIAGFSRMRALSTKFNDTPGLASRPFDVNRDGFVMSEGAGCLVLEDLESVIKRNAESKIYAEILGCGLNADVNHITNPSPNGDGAFRCMNLALEESKISPKQINYINAHATSTPTGDIAEIIAIKRVFNQVDSNQIENEIYISSLKGSLGHLLGAAGAVETIFTILSCKEKTMGPSINIETLDSNLKLDEMPFLKILQKTKTLNNRNNKNKFVALKNSFGFGGTNVSICIGNYSK